MPPPGRRRGIPGQAIEAEMHAVRLARRDCGDPRSIARMGRAAAGEMSNTSNPHARDFTVIQQHKLISDIIIGDRHRKRMGDIEGLARSIEAVGLLHPVVIDKDCRLIAGERRIRALLFLGRVKIPVTVVDLAEIVRGEFAENTEREDFTLTEAVSIKRAIEPLLKAEAKERQVIAGKLKGGASAKEVRQEDPTHRATHPYPTMSIKQICAVDVASIAHEDCIIFLWTTNHHMRHAYTVLDAWGFTDKTILTSVKDKFGTGDWLRGQTEHAIMAVRGEPIVQLTNQSTVLFGPMRANSQKPEEFYAFVEKLCPAPLYAELFSRQPHDKWDGHGDEARKPAAAAILKTS
jgi:N6-adenosine-specific RNA methylase IME4